jgi:photosystem II stability/assembly factor-like uncharacterized protein
MADSGGGVSEIATLINSSPAAAGTGVGIVYQGPSSIKIGGIGATWEDGSGNNSGLYFNTRNTSYTSKMYLSAAGNLGIGTVGVPQANLQIYSSSADGPSLSIATSGTGNQQSTINLLSESNGGDTLDNPTASGWQIWANSESNTVADDYGGAGGFGIGRSHRGGWESAALVIQAGGNIGIGTHARSTPPVAGFDVATSTALSGDITPAQITANQNDYNPTGLATASVLRLSSDASRDITGLSGGADGRVMTIFNIGANPVVFKNQSTSSTTANRFALGADMTLAADQSITLMYDATSQRWRSASIPFSQASGCFRTWTQWMTPIGDSGAINGRGIAASTDGTKTAAATDGYVYTTTDGGQTWIARTGLSITNAIASSSDGLKLAATNHGGNIYTSTNGGASWTTRATARNWTSIASSSDGTKLVAAVDGGKIYTSTDSGSSWTARASNAAWNRVVSSSNGNILLALVGGNDQLYVSTDSGTTWAARAGTNQWMDIAVSGDGTKMIATLHDDPDGYVAYVSTDSGATWVGSFLDGSSGCWGVWNAGAAFSRDGSRMAFACDGIFTSNDGGATWNKLIANGASGIAFSDDGKKIFSQPWDGNGIAMSECP